jgi:hypothetical protein
MNTNFEIMWKGAYVAKFKVPPQRLGRVADRSSETQSLSRDWNQGPPQYV